MIRIEKWCLTPPAGRPETRANPNTNVYAPAMVQEISITPDLSGPAGCSAAAAQTQVQVRGTLDRLILVTGAPLVLPFEDIFLRAPVRQEHDIVVTETDLAEWAGVYWSTT